MPYAAGVYTVPPGTTATTLTAIDSSDYNAFVADIEAAINSLTDGSVSWRAGLPAYAGTAALPGLTFSGDLNTGFYSAAADTIGFSAGGTGRMLMTTTALTPVTSDGLALGSTSLMWSDAFLASGAVLNFNNGNVTWTHSAGNMALGGSATDVVLDLSNAAAGQIKFPASQNASADANTLDDYEETSTSAVFTGSVSDPTCTYDIQAIKCTKVGRQVTGSVEIRTDTASGGSGDLRVGPLPHTSASDNTSCGGMGRVLAWGATYPVVWLIDSNTNYISFYVAPNSATKLACSDLTNSANSNRLTFDFTYIAAN